jgi:predicted ArsR family transcriptional regulator
MRALLRRILSRGRRRRQAIEELLRDHPDVMFDGIAVARRLGTWAGAVRPDLEYLWQRGRLSRWRDGNGRYYYAFKPVREDAVR